MTLNVFHLIKDFIDVAKNHGLVEETKVDKAKEDLKKLIVSRLVQDLKCLPNVDWEVQLRSILRDEGYSEVEIERDITENKTAHG